MNLGTMLTHIANRTGNDAVNSVVIEFINQIQYDFTSRYQFSWAQSLPITINTIANQKYLNPSAYLTNYGSPYDCVELSTPLKLRYIPIYDLFRADPDYAKSSPTNKGVPRAYSIDWNDQDPTQSRLWVYPMPDTAYPLSIRYMKNPPEISNTSSILFVPAKYHYVVAAGAESLVWQMDEDLQSSAAANQRYEAGIARAIADEVRSNDFEPIFESGQRFVDYSYPFSDF